MTPEAFQAAVLAWFDRHGRKELPWQIDPTPYTVWVSEIMLQQTRVTTVIPYFRRFTQQLPELKSLAEAPLETVLGLWSGLGYYARARNLHRTARIVVEKHGGELPADPELLSALPGIGRSTANAILSMGFHQRAAILDGNVKRVLSRFLAIEGWSGDTRVGRELWRHSERFTPARRVAQYTQAMMDLGATVCTRHRPTCPACPLEAACAARASGRVAAIPAPRPAKAIPVRHCYLLVIVNKQGEVYLEKRPPAGIWGGLWTFPEYTTPEALIEGCQKRRLADFTLEWLPQRRHTFSHFHLDYTPVLARADLDGTCVMEHREAMWYGLEQAHPHGLPAPIRRLLEHLTECKRPPSGESNDETSDVREAGR
jgi:A/G-specific adenine glycosylase